MSALLVRFLAATLALTPAAALAQSADSDDSQPLPANAPPMPTQTPAPPPADIPPPPTEAVQDAYAAAASPDDASADDEAPPDQEEPPPDQVTGQWVYTAEYGWVWAPDGEEYTNDTTSDVMPFVYVYFPTFGYRWIAAPWYYAGWWPFAYRWGGGYYPRGYTYAWYHGNAPQESGGWHRGGGGSGYATSPEGWNHMGGQSAGRAGKRWERGASVRGGGSSHGGGRGGHR